MKRDRDVISEIMLAVEDCDLGGHRRDHGWQAVMRVLADENMPEQVIAQLRAAGYFLSIYVEYANGHSIDL